MNGRWKLAGALVGALIIAACGGTESGELATLSTVPSTSSSVPSTTTPPPSTSPSSTTPSSTTPTSSSTSSTTSTSTAPSTLPPLDDPSIDDVAVVDEPADRFGEQIELDPPTFVIGYSVEGRPIIAERVGTEGGRRMLVFGVIHGNEDAGLQITEELRKRDIDPSVELWIIDSMNPDGLEKQIRQNANGVDLNRNFPYNWGPIGEYGHSQWAGTGPASEPETQAAVDFITWLRPDITIWYHQDANLIIPSTGRDGRIRARYAELTALPIADCCDGGIYTGIAATWARQELKRDSDAVPFIVELRGGELTDEEVQIHTDAVLTISVEG